MIKEYADFTYGIKFVMLEENWINSLIAVKNPKANLYKPVVTNSKPSYNPDTQKLQETITVQSNSVVRGWTVINKTAEEIAAEKNKTYTSYEFLLRFTPQERAAIRADAYANPTSITADFLHLAQTAQEVNTSDPTTISGMNYLVSVGLLTPQRRDQIMS